jgi:diacylglycerol kinase family enzyme
VIRIGALSRVGLLRSFPKIYAGTHVELPETETARARSVVFHDAQPVNCMIDGEIAVLRLKRLDVLPQALGMLV